MAKFCVDLDGFPKGVWMKVSAYVKVYANGETMLIDELCVGTDNYKETGEVKKEIAIKELRSGS